MEGVAAPLLVPYREEIPTEWLSHRSKRHLWRTVAGLASHSSLDTANTNHLVRLVCYKVLGGLLTPCMMTTGFTARQ